MLNTSASRFELPIFPERYRGHDISVCSGSYTALTPNSADPGVVLQSSFFSWANINITDCLYSLTSASALQKCPESSVYGCTNRQTGHQSWLCITLPNSRHTISPEANCGQLKQTADTIKVHSFTSRPSRRNNWAKTADGKEIPVASCIRPICYVVSLTLARAAEQIKNLKREKNAKLFL